ncbi:YczE/YyaS/YitT family protein [Pontibacillus halophilus]|uniref:YczE/YyaS/YitT family protein n=1 Tax=Pontibacillus halophilus TaxID=516704 RepID=UPI0004213A61|nr:hypothetical protein [Pontibacillus halophilus]
MRNISIRTLFFLVGLVTLSLGVSLTIKADLGAGAWDALNAGLTNAIGLTIGTWVMIIGALLIVVNALLGREFPDVFAVVTVSVLGPLIDFWLLKVLVGWSPSILVEQSLALVGGIVILALGVAMYIQPKLPLNPVDNFMVAIQKRFSISISKAKTITESLAFVFALLIGGPIGVGTVVILILVGPTINFFEPKTKTMLNRMLGEEKAG